ncbi:CpaF family protein [Streptomyces sp. NPDC059009]|uniref:CpaF family protein n=1 Tax=Streptomyces sp. NPDC059009 TaxID=3346694 RepID=UPI0036768CA4
MTDATTDSPDLLALETGQDGMRVSRGRTDPAALPGSVDDAGSPAEQLRLRLREQLSSQLSYRMKADEDAGRPPLGPEERRATAQAILAEAAEAYTQEQLSHGGSIVEPEVEERVIASLLDEVFGLAGLEPLLRNPEIENININGDRVFVRYADGRRDRLPPVVRSDAELIQLIRDLAARSGVEERRFDRGSPAVNFQLPGGERVFAVMAVTARPAVAIRRHRFQRVTLARLREGGTLEAGLESFLAAMVRARKNVLITGGTVMGKTTLLRALAAEIPPWERMVTIEDVFELGLDADSRAHPDAVALQAREANIEGQGAVSQAELVRWALRMSPDRVIVGEVRGPEVIPMCNAMSQGNDGSMGTLHASTSRGAFTKLAAYAVQGPERMSLEDTNLLVASALDFVVHLARPRDDEHKRVVSSVREVVDADGRQVVSNEVFRPGPDRRAVPGVPLRTETMDDLLAAGFDPDLLVRAEGWWLP